MKNLKIIVVFCTFMTLLALWGSNTCIRSVQAVFQEFSGIQLNEYVRWYSILFLRKLTHVIGFLILFKVIAKKSNIFMALGITILVAFLDEGLQVFIPGRTSSFLDILLDIGLPLFFTAIFVIKNKKYKKPSLI